MKLLPYSPRRRDGSGKLLCENCHEGRPGRPRAEAAKTPKQTLANHLAERHPRAPKQGTLTDLQRFHSRDHHRSYTNHYHEPDNAGPLIGPGTDSRRPSGWYTGLGVKERQKEIEAMNEAGPDQEAARGHSVFVCAVCSGPMGQDGLRAVGERLIHDSCLEEAHDEFEGKTAGMMSACPSCGQRLQKAVISHPGVTKALLSACHSGQCLAQMPHTLETIQHVVRSVTGTEHTAHDSGDGMTIAHCPFCGSGQVIGRSDGTIECEFCKNFFTVQVQPELPAFPQTVDGMPQQIPGMPGTPGPRPFDQDAQSQEHADQPPGQQPPPDQPPEEKKDSDKPPWLKGSSYYLTATGGVLNEEAYERHLAILYAEDREGVIADIRAEQ